MANTLTNLIPTIYAAMDVVSRERIGFIRACTIDATAERAAKDQSVRTHIAPAAAAEDITPGQLPPDTGDQTIGNVELKITKSRAVPFRWTGEEQLSVSGSGPGVSNILRDQIAQALRTLSNEVEVDLATAAAAASSRATGTAGTTPFGTDLSDSAELQRILDDNGAPMGDRHLVLNTAAAAALGSLAQLTNVNQAGTDATLRRGLLEDLHGFMLWKSAGIAAHTAGTGTGYLVDLVAGYAVGDTAIHVDTGTGTILAGDAITFADDTNVYIVATGFAGDGDGDIVLEEPGLRQALANDKALTILASHTPNIGFHRSSLVLLARRPALPEGGDSAIDRVDVQDPVSGITFEFARYAEYRRIRNEVALAWGATGIKPEHSAILLG